MGYKSHAQRKAVHASKAEQKAKGVSMKKYGASQKDFPEIKEKNQGKFTRWVEKNMPGVDTCKAASKIMRSRTKKYSPAVIKMANYANNFGCKKDGASMDHGKKGASFNPKLKQAVADGKIKGKFADAIMGASVEKDKLKREVRKSTLSDGKRRKQVFKKGDKFASKQVTKSPAGSKIKVKATSKMDGSTGKNKSHKVVAKSKAGKIVEKNGEVVKIRARKR